MWTQERKGALSRELLFDPLGSTERRALSVTRLLQLHMGMFMFLCEVRSLFVSFASHQTYWGICISSSFYRNALTANLASSANAAKKI